MESKIGKFCKRIGVAVIAGAMLVCNFQNIPVQAAAQIATEEDKEAFRQEIIEMLNTGDSTVHNVRNYNLTFSDYNAIFWDVTENECKISYSCYINQRPQTTKDAEGYIETFWLGNSDSGFPERYERMLASIAEVQSGLDDGMSDVEKTLYIHDWLVNHTYYYLDDDGIGFSQIAGGPLGLGYGVCAGYERALGLLLELEGIECTEIINSGHGWLGAKLDGEWYHIDPTWDDTRGQGKVSHRYFLLNDVEIGIDHFNWQYWNGGGYVDGVWQGELTKGTLSTSTKYSDWYVHNIAGDMFYDGGYWYYVENGSIVKNNIEGTAYETVVSGTALKIVSLDNGVLAYDDNGTVCEKKLVNDEDTDNSGNTDTTGNEGNTGNAGNTGNTGSTDNPGNNGNTGDSGNVWNIGSTDNDADPLGNFIIICRRYGVEDTTKYNEVDESVLCFLGNMKGKEIGKSGILGTVLLQVGNRMCNPS